VNRLKQWRGIATRYEKRAVNYRAMVIIAALMVWLASVNHQTRPRRLRRVPEAHACQERGREGDPPRRTPARR
jgi:hypothetical protein